MLSKGAPEVVQRLLAAVPPHYERCYKRYAAEGARVLALAHKQLPEGMTPSELRHLPRDEAESGLQFAGEAPCFGLGRHPMRRPRVNIVTPASWAQRVLCVPATLPVPHLAAAPACPRCHAGFAVFRSPLKPESEPALRMLRESLHQLIMITGGLPSRTACLLWFSPASPTRCTAPSALLKLHAAAEKVAGPLQVTRR